MANQHKPARPTKYSFCKALSSHPEISWQRWDCCLSTLCTWSSAVPKKEVGNMFLEVFHNSRSSVQSTHESRSTYRVHFVVLVLSIDILDVRHNVSVQGLQVERWQGVTHRDNTVPEHWHDSQMITTENITWVTAAKTGNYPVKTHIFENHTEFTAQQGRTKNSIKYCFKSYPCFTQACSDSQVYHL